MSSHAITREDLRLAIQLADFALSGGRWADGPPRTGPELQDFRDRMAHLHAAVVSAPAWGAEVFSVSFPLSLKGRSPKTGKEYTVAVAPTLNAYASMKPWLQKRVRKHVDALILAQLSKWPEAKLRGRLRPRAVRVTRFSSSMPDEIGVDVIGGKIPIDRLVEAGILQGDKAEDLQREPAWKRAAPGEGSLLVQVYELKL